MSRITLNTIGSRYGSIDALNANFEAIELALDNVLFLDNAAPNALQGNIDMDGNRILNLPNPTSSGEPINLAWATANYSDFQVVAGLATELAALGAITTEIEGVYAIDDSILALSSLTTEIAALGPLSTDIQGVYAIRDNVGTVAGDSAVITTVAGISTEVANVADLSTEITGVYNIRTNVGVVADNIGDVSAVANNIGDVTAVAANNTDISILAPIITDIQTLADIEDGTEDIDAIQRVASISTAVSNVSGALVAIGISNSNLTNINKVAAIDTDVTTVADIDVKVTAVADNTSNINAVFTNASNINAAVANETNINSAVANETNINAVVANETNINLVAAADGNITTVVNNLTDITNFADVYIGPSATNPTTRNDGSALVNGDFYFNTSNAGLYVWTGSVWEPSIANTSVTVILPYSNYTGAGTLTNNAGALVDTSGGSYTLNLPASPSIGDRVVVADAGDTFGANNLTIGQNGSTIDGVAEDFIIDISGVSVEFIYTGTTWAVYAVVGGTSGEFVVDTTSIQTLTNKTLTSPIITSPTITSPAISGTVTGTISLTTPTITDAQLNNPTIDNYTEGVVNNGTVSTSRTFNLTNGTLQNATLTASTTCTFTMPTPTAGKSFVCLLKQAPTTGNGNATFTGVKWNGAAPTITATAGAMDIISFVSDGTNWYGSITQGYTP